MYVDKYTRKKKVLVRKSWSHSSKMLIENTYILQSGLTPLHVASFMGCMNIVIFLLQHEANPDVPTVRGETPLHLAARANQTDIIRILLRNGAKVDARARVSKQRILLENHISGRDQVSLIFWQKSHFVTKRYI